MELGGKSYRVAGVSVAMSLSGKELVAIGEGVPFAVEDARWEYQVEFRSGTMEYEYEIDAGTGTILSRDVDSIYD